MPIARVIDGQVSEVREMSMDEVPSHKRDLWRPVHGDKPTVDTNRQRLVGPRYRVEAARVVREWNVIAVPPPAPDAMADRVAVLEAEVARLLGALSALAQEARRA